MSTKPAPGLPEAQQLSLDLLGGACKPGGSVTITYIPKSGLVMLLPNGLPMLSLLWHGSSIAPGSKTRWQLAPLLAFAETATEHGQFCVGLEPQASVTLAALATAALSYWDGSTRRPASALDLMQAVRRAKPTPAAPSDEQWLQLALRDLGVALCGDFVDVVAQLMQQCPARTLNSAVDWRKLPVALSWITCDAMATPFLAQFMRYGASRAPSRKLRRRLVRLGRQVVITHRRLLNQIADSCQWTDRFHFLASAALRRLLRASSSAEMPKQALVDAAVLAIVLAERQAYIEALGLAGSNVRCEVLELLQVCKGCDGLDRRVYELRRTRIAGEDLDEQTAGTRPKILLRWVGRCLSHLVDSVSSGGFAAVSFIDACDAILDNISMCDLTVRHLDLPWELLVDEMAVAELLVLQEAREKPDRRWPPEGRTMPLHVTTQLNASGLRVRELLAGSDLRLESLEQDHCLGLRRGYLEKALCGKARYFAVESERFDGVRATLEFVRNAVSDRWSLAEVRGFANADLSDRLPGSCDPQWRALGAFVGWFEAGGTGDGRRNPVRPDGDVGKIETSSKSDAGAVARS